MNAVDLGVILAGLGGVSWVNWYFFMTQGAGAGAGASGSGAQEVTVGVKGGYAPAVQRVRRGVPLTITFDRQETSGCSEEVVFPDFGVKRFLPAFERTTVELLPDRAGTFSYTCGMGMLRGELVVEDDREAAA